ncbi:aconitate hydratase [Acidaminobacter hydrogenoformans]|uniref:Aconitase n=1 Tax=Acidaminobacter hydrogenoformans DSM 2784 TaxID=1120920 RepID=A0A1G5S632_9FIRM|nr:aconitate hydratase [Acidaminobacter hydrogenoformans]SCZ81804.1 aconitase [Acidaminobacter hydrogenoformans DSM 2784]
MGMTITEKILSRALVEGELVRGTRIGIKADQTLTHDLNGVMSYLVLEAIGLKQKKVATAVQYIDHNMLQSDFKNADDHSFILDMTSKLGIITARSGNGICHHLHLEHFSAPGKVLIGGDSHTVAAGGVGSFSVGVGGFDNAMAIAGEPFYMTMPKIVNVRLTGKLQPFVSAKNIILELLRRVSVKGGIGKVFEYSGDGVKTLNVAERSIITNMGAETGATTSIFPSDENTQKWLKAFEREADFLSLEADPDAVYDEVIEIDLSTLEPLIALPSQPDKVVKVSEVAGLKIDQVMIGSCTNTSVQDLLSVASILEGETIHRDVVLGVYPSTRTVIREIVKRGAYEKIVATGARIFEPVCGGCNGCGFAPPSGGVSLRTTPRNFKGRSGTKDDQVYLVAPETAAASAITGVITDPRALGKTYPEFEVPEKYISDKSIFIMPENNPEQVVRKGPNIKPIPELSDLPESMEAPVSIKLGDDISTDFICPAGALYLPIRSNIPEISKYSFQVVDPTFAQRAMDAKTSIIVAGHNYGQGSSREQAAIIPRYLGISVVMAKGFARLHLANMVNWGILPLVFKNDSDYEAISQGDTLKLDHFDLKEGEDVFVRNLTKNETYALKTPLFQADLDAIRQGGVVNMLKKKNAK